MEENEDNFDVNKHLTIAIFTSPIKSNPSTCIIMEMIDSMFQTEALRECKNIFVYCDGYLVTEKKEEFKLGKISQTTAENYEGFIAELEKKTGEEKYKNIKICRQKQRNGFAENVRMALGEMKTEIVFIAQHDYLFQTCFDAKKVVLQMTKFPELNYVGLTATSTTGLSTWLPSLFPKFWTDLKEHLEDPQLNAEKLKEHFKRVYGLPLLPLPFFYDKPHFANVSYYRSIFGVHHKVFHEGKQVLSVKVSNFIEDTLGNVIRRDFKLNGLEAFLKYKTFILVDTDNTEDFKDKSKVILSHTDGRKFLTQTQKKEIFNL